MKRTRPDLTDDQLDKPGVSLERLNEAATPPFELPTNLPLAYNESLKGQNVVVVGAAAKPSLGRGFVDRLLEIGANVFIIDYNRDAMATMIAELHEAGHEGKFETYVADTRDSGEIARVFDSIGKKSGRQIHAMVITAAVAGPNKPVLDLSDKDFDDVIGVNEKGTFIVCRECFKYMKPHNYGRVLILASIAGAVGNPGQGFYPLTKGHAIAAARTLGHQYVQTGVTFNAAIMTTLPTSMVTGCTERNVRYMEDAIPMGCIGQIWSFVETCLPYLAWNTYYTTGEVAVRHCGGRFNG